MLVAVGRVAYLFDEFESLLLSGDLPLVLANCPGFYTPFYNNLTEF